MELIAIEFSNSLPQKTQDLDNKSTKGLEHNLWKSPHQRDYSLLALMPLQK